MRICALLLIGVCLASAAGPPYAPGDLWAWRTPAEPHVTADGRWVASIERWNSRAGNAVYSALRIVSAGGKDRLAARDGAWRDSSPRWAPEGDRLAWISDREGSPRIYVRAVTPGGQERALDLGRAPLAFAWSPDGASVAFTARERESPAQAAWAPPAILALLQPRAGKTSVFIAPAAGGEPRRISSGGADCSGEPAWTPDGQWVLAACDGDLLAFHSTGEAMRRLTSGQGTWERPLVSPDGSKVACLLREAKPLDYVPRKVYVIAVEGGRARPLSGSLDRDARDPQWSSDSRTVYFLADDRGSTHVYAARSDGAVRQVTRARERLEGFSLADNGRAASVASAAGGGPELVSFDVFGPEGRLILDSPNRDLIAAREAGAVEEIEYQSDGRPVQAWLVKPPGFDPAGKYPLVIDVRDAPRSMYGVELNPRAQSFAGRGFLVLCANPRGAPGYGLDFGNVLRTRSPGDDFDDLLRGVDFLAARGFVDPKRVFIDGGVLTAWAIGHSDRFAAAVARRAKVWTDAAPWEDPQLFAARSPIFFARGFRTPTLVLAGENDPDSDALYAALRTQKVESALVRVTEPQPSRDVLELEAALAWFSRW